jgi:hypothetical protein
MRKREERWDAHSHVVVECEDLLLHSEDLLLVADLLRDERGVKVHELVGEFEELVTVLIQQRYAWSAHGYNKRLERRTLSPVEAEGLALDPEARSLVHDACNGVVAATERESLLLHLERHCPLMVVVLGEHTNGVWCRVEEGHSLRHGESY